MISRRDSFGLWDAGEGDEMGNGQRHRRTDDERRAAAAAQRRLHRRRGQGGLLDRSLGRRRPLQPARLEVGASEKESGTLSLSLSNPLMEYSWLYHPRDIPSSRLYWPLSAGTEFLHYKTSGYIIQPSGYISHFERCEREHLRA